MLNEVTHVTQYEPKKFRRWFHDEFFDLYTWETANGAMLGFQLCYAKNGQERALRWSLGDGYRHEGVDANEEKPGRAMSAFFVVDGVFDANSVGTHFVEASITLPEKIKAFVGERITAYERETSQ